MRRSILLVTALCSTSAFALPPGAGVKLQQGANHHIGDASFIAKFGRPPTADDAERVRMTTHLQHVHDWLAARPATRPELAEKRAAILKALETYIAKGTTPHNFDLPWRTPVFIDEEGTICAVGYLIESTEGRALPEKIAKKHRYDFIEDIAKDMPEVQQWVEDSGLTLEEIQTIQPAYDEPMVNQWRGWDLVKFRPKDGPSTRYGSGNFKHGNMDGEWKVFGDTENKVIVGMGKMKNGRGEWTSFYPTGEKLAEGRYAANQPDGEWRMYHRSGNLAAEGAFERGTRVGKWRFYYDTAAKTPIALGRFGSDGSVRGTWRHFDNEGGLLARSWTETPSQWEDDSIGVNGGEGSVLDVLPGRDGVRHKVHQGTPGHDVEMNEFSLEVFSKGKEQLWISKALGVETWYGADGAKLVHDGGTWAATSCHWSRLRKEIAAEGDVARLDGVLSNAAMQRARAKQAEKYSSLEDPGPVCSGSVEISAQRAKRLDALLASRDAVRAPTATMVRDLILDQEDDAPKAEDDAEETDEHKQEKLRTSDLARVLAGHMAMYIEWPHVDRRFKQVYATMAGRYARFWASRSETDGDPSLTD
jgi:antitoxin component YwqK of YwqJK toxin-antitoxin module